MGSVASQRSSLSQMSSSSAYSAMSTASHSSTASQVSRFSIVGMEHSLLSRGAAHSDQTSQGQVYSSQKMRRRKEARTGVKGGKDVWGLRREGNQSELVWAMADLGSVAAIASGICAALLLAGGERNTKLASRLQAAVDDYAEVLLNMPVLMAPAYPKDWLRSREMDAVLHFQPGDDKTEVENYLARIQSGLASWKLSKINSMVSKRL